MTRSLCRGWDDYLGCPWQEVQSVKNACYYPWHSRYHRQEEAACLGCEYVVGKTWDHMHGSIQRVSSRTCSDVRVVHTLMPGPLWCLVSHDPAKEDLCWTVRAISYQISSWNWRPAMWVWDKPTPGSSSRAPQNICLALWIGERDRQSLGNETGWWDPRGSWFRIRTPLPGSIIDPFQALEGTKKWDLLSFFTCVWGQSWSQASALIHSWLTVCLWTSHWILPDLCPIIYKMKWLTQQSAMWPKDSATLQVYGKVDIIKSR